MSTAGPFSLLLEWLASPQVVGSFTIFGVGAALTALLGGLSSFFDDKLCYTLNAVFFVCAFIMGGITFISLIAFNVWAGGM